eukprot:scaffold150380_cov28-Tisochrysis_lutea.AAC.9
MPWPPFVPAAAVSLASTWCPLAIASRWRGTRRASIVTVRRHRAGAPLPRCSGASSSSTLVTGSLAARRASVSASSTGTSEAEAISLESPNVS